MMPLPLSNSLLTLLGMVVNPYRKTFRAEAPADGGTPAGEDMLFTLTGFGGVQPLLQPNRGGFEECFS
jgi:hypothetical protein